MQQERLNDGLKSLNAVSPCRSVEFKLFRCYWLGEIRYQLDGRCFRKDGRQSLDQRVSRIFRDGLLGVAGEIRAPFICSVLDEVF